MDTKNCRSCLEPINLAATKCPRCQSFQSRSWMWWSTLFASAPLIIVLTLIFTISSTLNSDSNRDEIRFVPSDSEIIVVDAKLKYETPKIEEGITYHYVRREAWVYCTIKNESKHRWENLEFVVEFQGANGERVDLVNSSASVTTHPGHDLECRIQCDLSVDPKDVATTLVTITDARRPWR